MCDLCTDTKQVPFKEIPIWAILRANKILKETIFSTDQLVKKIWTRKGSEYICYGIFKWFNDYEWSEDHIRIVLTKEYSRY